MKIMQPDEEDGTRKKISRERGGERNVKITSQLEGQHTSIEDERKTMSQQINKPSFADQSSQQEQLTKETSIEQYPDGDECSATERCLISSTFSNPSTEARTSSSHTH
jgi:hypothetical protein